MCILLNNSKDSNWRIQFDQCHYSYSVFSMTNEYLSCEIQFFIHKTVISLIILVHTTVNDSQFTKVNALLFLEFWASSILAGILTNWMSTLTCNYSPGRQMASEYRAESQSFINLITRVKLTSSVTLGVLPLGFGASNFICTI